MKLHPRVTQAAVDLVKRFEGFRPRAAKTPEGRFTIGYGHVLSPRDSVAGAEISEPEAEFLLKHDLSVVAEAVEESLLAPVNENQFAALLSFAFNIGVENFKGSSALRRLNEGAYLQAAAALELWRRAEFGGETLVVDQLVRRRAVEKALFLAPPEGFMPLPSSVLRPSFDQSVIGAAVAWATARERTAVSRIALEGRETAPSLLTPPGREGEPAPAAAIAAADALAVRLNRVLPEDVGADADAAPEPVEPPAFPAAKAFEEPPLLVHAETSAPVDPFETPDERPGEAAPGSAEQPLIVSPLKPAPDASPLGLWRRRITRPNASRPRVPAPVPAPEAAPEPEASPELEATPEPEATPTPEAPPTLAAEPKLETPPEPALEAEAPPVAAPFDGLETATEEEAVPASKEAVAAPAPPLFERPVFFAVLGATGAALFLGSIFCMINRASITCLLIGVLGVLAMAPAAAFFLFRFLGKPVDLTAEERAALAKAVPEEAAGPHAVEPDPAAPPAIDPFENAER